MIFVIHDPIYVQDVLVSIAETDVRGIVKAVQKYYTISDPKELAELLELGPAHGRTVLDKPSGAVAINLAKLHLSDPKDLGHLAHECVHAATMLFSRIGFPLKTETDEPLAYYVQFLMRTILKRVKAAPGRKKERP